MVAATGLPADRCHENTEAAAALGAEARRLEHAATAPLARAVRNGQTAPAAVAGHIIFGHITFESDPIGIRRSSSIARSSWGDLPRVVR